MFEAAIELPPWPAGRAGVVEPDEDVVAAPVQGPSALGEFVEAVWDCGLDLVDDRGRQLLPVGSIGRPVGGTTITCNLHELEDHGYVTDDLPRESRRRRRTRWTLNHAGPNADLGALVQATTPTGDPSTRKR